MRGKATHWWLPRNPNPLECSSYQIWMEQPSIWPVQGSLLDSVCAGAEVEGGRSLARWHSRKALHCAWERMNKDIYCSIVYNSNKGNNFTIDSIVSSPLCLLTHLIIHTSNYCSNTMILVVLVSPLYKWETEVHTQKPIIIMRQDFKN